MIFICLLFYSCENITPQDFGPNDIANMLDVVWKKDGADSEADASGEDEDSEGFIDGIYAAENTEPFSVGSEPAQADSEPVESEAPAESETETVEPAPEPQNTTEPSANISMNVATVIDVRNVFPDIPEKFTGVLYPESVIMTDSFKKSIKRLADFSPKDFSGMYFYIMTTDAKLFKPNFSGEMLSDARRYRTGLADAECNTVIASIERPKESIVQEIKLAVQTDEFISDILCVPFDIQSELVRNGYLMNLKKIPFLNPGAEYYNASATEALTVNGNIYGLVSDLTFDPSNIYAVFYNKTLVKEYELSNPVQMYKDGKWNYDGMFNISKELSSAIADLNHDLRWSVGLDKENPDIINGLFMTSGGKYFTKRDYGYPVLSFNGEKTLKIIDAVSKIFYPPADFKTENYLVSGDWNQNKAFSNGNVLFSVLKLDVIPEMANSEVDWGILPFPALDENGYANGAPYSFTDGNALGISVLKNTRNTEACGIVASALSQISHQELKNIYVKEQMTYNLRDVDSVIILGDILRNISFSQYNAFSTFPEVYGSTVGVLKDTANKKGDFAVLYENNRKILNDFFKSSRIFERD
ncbi:MAG: extracellular solute-binding protein [Oscillospiraceae bacterium]|nr:extracellular solute-binding protein [Oscillospiraceae bacterium]